MKPLSATETQAISGGLRSQFASAERGWRRSEPLDPIVPIDVPSEVAGPTRSIGAPASAFAQPIALAGFIAPTFMSGEPIRTIPILDTPLTIVDSPDDGLAEAQADTSVAASNADTFGGGGDAGAAGGCSAGDSGGCGW